MELTRRELDEELAEKQADVQALLQSRDILFKRIVEVQDTTKSKLMPLHEWAGAHALMNTFDIVINAAEKLVEELKALRDNTKEEPRLRIVRNDE
jgi:hypothetical protein